MFLGGGYSTEAYRSDGPTRSHTPWSGTSNVMGLRTHPTSEGRLSRRRDAELAVEGVGVHRPPEERADLLVGLFEAGRGQDVAPVRHAGGGVGQARAREAREHVLGVHLR